MLLRGSFTALVTPFVSDVVDEGSLRSLTQWHLAQGSAGVVPCGTTGEGSALTAAEHAQVVRAVAAECHAKGKLCIAGAGTNNTRTTIEKVRASKEAGADAVLVVTPYYNKPTQEGLFRHYEAVAKQGGLPVVVYNIPGRASVDLTAETMARLAKVPGIVGIKEASGNIARAAEILHLTGDSVAVLAGDDLFVAPTLALGGHGVISACANVLPGDFAQMCSAYERGDAKAAGKLQTRMAPLVKAMFSEPNPQPVKYALKKMGRIKSAELRLPLVDVTRETAAKLDAVLEAHGGLL